jgi:hypothetical protein
MVLACQEPQQRSFSSVRAEDGAAPKFDIRDALRGFRPHVIPEAGTELVRWSPELEGRDGAGVRIALLDGGACLADPDLAGAAVVSADFTGDPAGSPDDERHATRDLKLLVGQGRRSVRGLVPAAEVLHARVLTGEGGDPEAIARAIAWAFGEGAEIVLMPLGMDDFDAEIAAQIDRGLAAGICFFAAAGNGFPRPLDFPARHPGVLAVGAADWTGALLPSICRLPRLDRIALGCDLPGLPGSGSSVASVLAGGVEALRRAAS